MYSKIDLLLARITLFDSLYRIRTQPAKSLYHLNPRFSVLAPEILVVTDEATTIGLEGR